MFSSTWTSPASVPMQTSPSRTAGEDRAVIPASHDERALDRADRVVHLRDGRRVER